MKKVLFVASSGGHLSEMLKLESIFKFYEYYLVTESTTVTEELANKYNMIYLKYGPNSNIFKYIYTSIYNLIKCFNVIRKFRPETIVTTGAQVGGFMCFVGKLFKCKIIYIESLAKTKTLSKTGQVVYKFADKFYVQWESLAKNYEKADYLGRLM